MITELKAPKYITSTERLKETNDTAETLKNEQINESLSSFSQRQKDSIRKIIKDNYKNLENLSK